MLLHMLLSKGPKGLGVLCLGPSRHWSPLKGAGDLELFKSCVSIYTPVVLSESLPPSRLEERYFGGVNRLFTSLMSGGVMLLVGVRELQGVLSCQGAGSAGEGPGQETRADFRSWQCCTAVPWCLWLCHHPGGGCTMVPWYLWQYHCPRGGCTVVPWCPWLCQRSGGGQAPVPHHMQPAALALWAAPAKGQAEPLRRGGNSQS